MIRNKRDSVVDPLEDFFASAPEKLASLRKALSEANQASDVAAREKAVVEFLDQTCSLKRLAQLPELRPAWLMACALEGLFNQLSRCVADFKSSVFKTVEAAMDLLEALCIRGVNPELGSQPPVRLLAIDDDAVTRLALSFALKKSFNALDLAPDGETGLSLATQQAYDAVFLDVGMPGMDGYEVCRKIHQTACNRTTPVVFVTRHSDFDSRAKSTLSGGQDLIAKPFLSFEITVKALTLALRARLEGRLPESATDHTDAVERPLATNVTVASPPTPDFHAPNPATTEKPVLTNDEENNAKCEPQATGLTQPPDCSPCEPAGDSPVISFGPAHVEELNNHLHAAQRARDPAQVQKLLAQVSSGARSLAAEAQRANLPALLRLSSALEGLLQKMLENTQLCAPSTFAAATAALGLLEDLCRDTDSHPDLGQPPVRILVVDDDPIARRAISVSIQLIIGKPDTADSGEAALMLADEKSFDLIFLDVLMPGMDGFATCKKIRQSKLNRRTPVVFVTSHDDTDARSRAVVSGGCGFIPKPVLPSQITLVTLTCILRTRLAASKLVSALEPTPNSARQRQGALVATT